MVKPPRRQPSTTREILCCIENGETYATIAKRYHISPATVGQIARKKGIRKNTTKRYGVGTIAKEVIQLYRDGYTQAMIADDLGITRQAVFVHLQRVKKYGYYAYKKSLPRGTSRR